MDIQHHSPATWLERYSFLWSEVRLVIAAVALFVGGVPPLFYFFHFAGLYGFMSGLLTLCWILSGLASVYLLYRWYSGDKRVFGSTQPLNTVLFLVSTISGINLGLAGLIKRNIGMSITHNHTVFVLVGLLYLFTAWYMYQRWQKHGQRVF